MMLVTVPIFVSQGNSIRTSPLVITMFCLSNVSDQQRQMMEPLQLPDSIAIFRNFLSQQ